MPPKQQKSAEQLAKEKEQREQGKATREVARQQELEKKTAEYQRKLSAAAMQSFNVPASTPAYSKLSKQIFGVNPDENEWVDYDDDPESAGKDLPIQEGVNFIAKPFESHQLAQTIRNRLDQ